MTFAKLIKSSSLVLLLTIASTSNAFSTSGSSAISSSSSSSGKSSSDLGSSESRSYSSHANSGEASSVAAAQTAALYSLSKAMASALAATRQNADAAAAVAASQASSSASSSHGASASNIEESSEEYVPKRKTVILAIPVKLALQQAAAAAAMANERSPSAPTPLAHLPSSAAYEEHAQVTSPSYAPVNANGNTASAVYSNVQHAPQQQSQLVSYAPQSYQVQSVATPSPAPITVRQPVVYASAPPPAPVTYTASAPVQAAPVSHQPERPTYSDKSPAKFENEVDSAYVDAQTGSTYSGNAQSYENASPVVRSRGPTAASAASADPSEYETEEVPVNVSPVRKNKKAKQVYYLDEQSEGEDAYATLPKSLKIKSPYAAASSAGSLEGLEEFTDAYPSATGLRNAAPGLNGEEDYASALAGASALYPQSTGDLSSLYLKSSRHNSPYAAAAAAANAHSAYSFGALGAPATGYPRASSYGFPRAASSHRPLYSPGSSPYSTSSAHFKPTYSGSPFGASSAPRMYLPSASSPYKSYFNPGSAMPFASSSPYASYASASSSSASVSSPFASSSSGLSSFPGLRIGGSNGISIPAGNKGVRIGPLEFSSGGSSSIFPTIKIKSPTRSM